MAKRSTRSAFQALKPDAFARFVAAVEGSSSLALHDGDPGVVALAQLLWHLDQQHQRQARREAGPFLVGITGSVAVGKSTLALQLRNRLHRLGIDGVVIVTTDSFLYPNHMLEDMGRMARKGFPESFDVARLLAFLTALRHPSRAPQSIPVYSHEQKDIVAGEERVIEIGEVMILEGVNLLSEQFFYLGEAFSVRDYLDCAVYVEAAEDDVESWFHDRFVKARKAARTRGNAYFQRLAGLSETQFDDYVQNIWHSVNIQLLNEALLPYRGTVDLILHKDAGHRVVRIDLARRFRNLVLEDEPATEPERLGYQR
jgi:type I pantothenate kinase